MANESKNNSMCLDIVICADLNRSINPAIYEIQDDALLFIQKAFKENDYQHVPETLDQISIKIAAYRSYGVDTEATLESPFFCLGIKDEHEQFDKFITELEALYGKSEQKDPPECVSVVLEPNVIRNDTERNVLWMFSNAGIGWINRQLHSISEKSNIKS